MYAPVIIPTLNRYEHLKECLESLRRNDAASQTEIFISVDFLPSTKYIEGYERIKEYLSHEQEGFKAVHLFFQSENLGEFSNIDFLINQIRANYDRFIFTEDDNVFATNFLKYMNICLDKYEYDESIYAICGYMWPLEQKTTSEEVIKISNIFSAWGYSVWLDKMDRLNDHINLAELEDNEERTVDKKTP